MGPKNSTQYGTRLIPQILDDLAAEEPDRILYSIASFSNGSASFQHISARSFAKAVDKTAWWLHYQVGMFETIRPLGYVGPHDLRHVLLTYAAVKAGCTALFLSPKNNVEGAIAVLEATKCDIWINALGETPDPLVTSLLQHRSMTVLELPTLEELLDAESTESFLYNKSFGESAQEPFCLLHTSGTTGVPKPIPWSHGLIGTMDAVRLLPPTEGDCGLAPWTSIWHKGDTLYSSFPMSHGAGVIMNIIMPSLFDLRCVLGPSSVLPNMHLIESLADHAQIDIWSMVPSLVDELGKNLEVLEKLKSSKFICASGGPVSPEIASTVNDKVRILNLTGTTEGLFIGNLVVEREDWLWFAFHPYSGFEFKELEPDTYEHWVHRNEHWPLFQGIFHTFPDKQSINLKDLYIKHPSKPSHWAFKGRSDDVVVLSNGYKISPLTTEAYISTHPAVLGCLVIGTGKQQAGLLVELKNVSSKDNQLFNSIWETVEKSNNLSAQKTRLLRNYVAFAKADKPFIRTDKGTVKRHATLALYADFIDRFYNSREEDSETVTVDVSSIETIIESVRNVLGSSLPAIYEATPETDVFSLGLDSLFVFRAISSIRTAMGLKDKLAPRHLYANPTLAKFSCLLARLAFEAGQQKDLILPHGVDDSTSKLKAMIEKHKARQSIKMNPFDQVNQNHYMGLNFFFPLHQGVNFESAFIKLQAGLRRLMELIPALDGKMMPCSEQEMGFKTGDMRLTIPPLSESRKRETTAPRQLSYADLSGVLPSFEYLRNTGFLPSAVKDDLVLPCNPFPTYPADIVVARANFIKGGCILAVNFNHQCLDAVGVMVALKVWAESCRYLDGEESATCSWLDPESFNHDLPEILHELEGNKRATHEVDPGVWGFLPFLRPEGSYHKLVRNGITQEGERHRENGNRLPPPPSWNHKFIWPPVPDPAGRSLRTVMFLIPPEKLKELKQEVVADPEAKGVITSISDIVQAFFWRTAIRARYRVAKEIRGETFGPDEISILELPIDGRPYFSPLLPSTYMGSMLILNRPTMSVETLCAPETSIGRIAFELREAAARITPSLVSDAFNLLQSLPKYDRFSLADMGLDGMHAMISNLILFQPSEISFGDSVFANNGSPEALRPQIERANCRLRFLIIYPMRRDGGVELALGTLPEELKMLKDDNEFMKYARLVDC